VSEPEVEAPAYTCTYGIQPPQVEALADALADALLGRIPFGGSLPVELDAGGDAR